MAKTKKRTRAQETKELDRVFSVYIRKKYADKKGMVKCFTSGVVMHWTKAHAGHYISRRVRSVRWDEDNVRPQSAGENIWKHGNTVEFRINLVKELGEARVEALEARRQDLFNPSKGFFAEKIDYYNRLIEQM